MSLEKLKAEAVKLRQNIDAVYAAGKAAGGGDSYYDVFWDDYQQNGARKDYSYAFCGDCWSEETLKPKYNIAPVDTSSTTRNAMGMFSYFARRANPPFDVTELCKKLDLSSVLSAQNLFHNAKVKNITLNLSNVETMNSCFNANDGGWISGYVTLTVSEKCTVYTNAFNRMSYVEQLTFTDGSVIAADISFAQSNVLTDESVQSIINALKDFTGGTSKKVTFHTDVVNRLTDEQLTQIALKNWQLG